MLGFTLKSAGTVYVRDIPVFINHLIRGPVSILDILDLGRNRSRSTAVRYLQLVLGEGFGVETGK